MNIADIVSADRIRMLDDVASKKRALERLSELLSEATPLVTENEIFTALVGREKLGSTGIGAGIAIPHGRLKGVNECAGAMIRLSHPVDFGAPDDQPVDILFGLVVPEKSTEEHLELLRALAKLFSEGGCLDSLRASGDDGSLFAALNDQCARHDN